MKKGSLLLGIFSLLLFLPSCSGEYGKNDFSASREAFVQIAAIGRKAFSESGSSELCAFDKEEPRLVLLITHVENGIGLRNTKTKRSFKSSDAMQNYLKTISTMRIDHLWITKQEVFFWVEGHNNGILFTETPFRTKHRLKAWFSGRIFRLDQNWYCLGEHYI